MKIEFNPLEQEKRESYCKNVSQAVLYILSQNPKWLNLIESNSNGELPGFRVLWFKDEFLKPILEKYNLKPEEIEVAILEITSKKDNYDVLHGNHFHKEPLSVVASIDIQTPMSICMGKINTDSQGSFLLHEYDLREGPLTIPEGYAHVFYPKYVGNKYFLAVTMPPIKQDVSKYDFEQIPSCFF